MNILKVAIIGANGKMGSLVSNLISKLEQYKIVATIGRMDSLGSILQDTKPDIAIELTSNLSVFDNTKTIIQNNVRPIIGSSGLTQNEIKHLSVECDNKSLGGLIIPNFSLGIACVNKMSNTLKEHFSDFSIVEYHHRAKKDKPSGTAKHLANILTLDESEIASVRSDDFLAKLQLYVASQYERIIIDHESFDRKSFEPGIILSLKKIMELNKLVIGLENIL
jgi:4-hydroxy-tetrahydrodipicolinate reductase